MTILANRELVGCVEVGQRKCAAQEETFVSLKKGQWSTVICRNDEVGSLRALAADAAKNDRHRPDKLRD